MSENVKTVNDLDRKIQDNELTFFQKVALQGEIANMYQDTTDTEAKYFTFVKLAKVEEKLLLVTKNEILKYIDDIDFVNDCVTYRYNEIVPVYLYADKIIEEMESMLSGECGNVRLKKSAESVIQSKFINFAREMVTYLPDTGKAIISAIIAKIDNDLEFMYPVLFALQEYCTTTNSKADESKVGFDVKLKVLSTPIYQTPILNVDSEIARVEHMAKIESMSPIDRVVAAMSMLASSMSDKEEAQTKSTYIIKKIDKATDEVVFTKEFNVQHEATEYIKNIVDNYPDITKRFYFSVELVEEIVHE